MVDVASEWQFLHGQAMPRGAGMEGRLMVTVAVTGVSTPLGRAVLDRLDGDAGVDRIIGVDRQWPQPGVAKLDMRLTNAFDPDLSSLLAGAQVIVNLATAEAGAGAGGQRAAIVEGTQSLLDAAAAIGVHTFVQMSTAMAYGARPDNPVPLTEAAPLRAEPGFPPAHNAVLAEQLVTSFVRDHPDLRAVVLRPAPLLGQTEESPLLRHLESPFLALVADHDPPLQFCDVRDLAHAVHLAAMADLRGAFNVASDGWLTAAEVSRLLGRPRLHLPEAIAFALADGLASLGVLEAGTPWVQYLMYPWIVDTNALKDHGWTATLSNRDLVRAFVRDHHDVWRIGPFRLSRRRVAMGAGAASFAGAATATAIAWYLVHRWRWTRGS